MKLACHGHAMRAAQQPRQSCDAWNRDFQHAAAISRPWSRRALSMGSSSAGAPIAAAQARGSIVVNVQSDGSSSAAAGPGGPQGMGGMSGNPGAAGALVRRPSLVPMAPQQQQIVFIDMSQVVGKQVITTATGRDLGVVSCVWVDPSRGEVVSLDLDDKKGVGGTRIANVYLSRLTQIGDVVLVQDEQVLYDQPLDGRYGLIILAGMEVRTRSGDFLGKVRDFSFSPDTGALSKVTYDDFGLSFLPFNFFDTFSLSMADVLSLGPSGIIVSEEAKYRERKETSGLFAAIPSLLRTMNTGGAGGRAPAGLLGTSESYRQQDRSNYLPQGYSYEQWEVDIQLWEQETGLTYDEYITRAQAGGSRNRQLPAGALQRPVAPSRPTAAEPFRSYGAPMQPPQQQQQQQSSSWPSMQRPPQQQQQQQPAYSNQLQRPMQPRQPQSADPRYRGPNPSTSSPYSTSAPPGTAGRPMQQGMRDPQQPRAQPPQPQQPPPPPQQQQQSQPSQSQQPPQQQRPPMQQQQQAPGPRQSPSAQMSGRSSAASAATKAADMGGRRRIDDYIAQDRVREAVAEPASEQALSAGWPEVPASSQRGRYYQQ